MLIICLYQTNFKLNIKTVGENKYIHSLPLHAVNQMLWVQRGEGFSVFYELVVSFKAEKRKVNVGDVWFQVSPPSLSFSVGVLVRGPSSTFF